MSMDGWEKLIEAANQTSLVMAQNRERRRMHDEERLLFGTFASQSVIGKHRAEFREFCEDRMLADVSDMIAAREEWHRLYSTFLAERHKTRQKGE